MKTIYTEIAWVEKGGHPTHITDNIEALVGYTANEVRKMDNPIRVFAVDTPIPPKGPINTIMSLTVPLTLRHRKGHDIVCEGTFICLYDEAGHLAEVWGAIRRMPCQALFNDIKAWWEMANDRARLIIHDTVLMYPPIAA